MTFVEEVVVGLTVDAIATLSRQASTALTSDGRRRREEVEIAKSFDSYALVDRAFPPVPNDVDQDALIKRLRTNEAQAIIQELFAVRLSDAPELTAQRLRSEFTRICQTSYAELIFDKLDDVASDLVGHIGATDANILHQIRQEAHFTRLNATVEAINRHLAAFLSSYDPEDDKEFLLRYRRHIAEYHGMIEPPDFDRRRKVAISDIYVQPQIVKNLEDGFIIVTRKGEQVIEPTHIEIDKFDKEIDRTVLLGNPGAGKTTTSQVLLYRHAIDHDLRVPFLVTLRDFAASNPPQWSVVEFIENRLRTFYQCPSPKGVLNRLLLAGNALVIFDGLDELIDTSRRADVSAIIEQFSIEYPLARIFVTSRIVGYDQARLDERQFSILAIREFSEQQVSEYVQKWFKLEPGISPDEATYLANSLISESSSIPDLRSNPLMLALICILYRGERSIPQSRADIYEKCADLLFRRCDSHRKIFVQLRARHLVESAIRYLAYWMLSRDDTRPVVTRRELVLETTSYFRSRGFDESYDASTAAEEFVDFSRGRAWVFTDVGSTGTGEQLYAFTHRTFLEYFAAYYLSSVYERPEKLAYILASKVAKGEWDMVGQLAVQIKDRNTECGADRIFETLIHERRKRSVEHRGNVLAFLARCLSAVRPRHSLVRELAQAILDSPFDTYMLLRSEGKPLLDLIENSREEKDAVAAEITVKITKLLNDHEPISTQIALELGCAIPSLLSIYAPYIPEYWIDFSEENAQKYMSVLISSARDNDAMLWIAYNRGSLSADEVIANCANDIGRLFRTYWFSAFSFGLMSPFLPGLNSVLINSPLNWSEDLNSFLALVAAFGRFFRDSNGRLEVTNIESRNFEILLFGTPHTYSDVKADATAPEAPVDTDIYLGAIAVICIGIEILSADLRLSGYKSVRFANVIPLFHNFEPYVNLRLGIPYPVSLPALQLDESLSRIFTDWARGDLSFLRAQHATA